MSDLNISNKWFSVEIRNERQYDELCGAHYIPSRQKWIPADISLDLERAKSLKDILDKYIAEKERMEWMDNLR